MRNKIEQLQRYYRNYRPHGVDLPTIFLEVQPIFHVFQRARLTTFLRIRLLARTFFMLTAI